MKILTIFLLTLIQIVSISTAQSDLTPHRYLPKPPPPDYGTNAIKVNIVLGGVGGYNKPMSVLPNGQLTYNIKGHYDASTEFVLIPTDGKTIVDGSTVEIRSVKSADYLYVTDEQNPRGRGRYMGTHPSKKQIFVVDRVSPRPWDEGTPIEEGTYIELKDQLSQTAGVILKPEGNFTRIRWGKDNEGEEGAMYQLVNVQNINPKAPSNPRPPNNKTPKQEIESFSIKSETNEAELGSKITFRAYAKFKGQNEKIDVTSETSFSALKSQCRGALDASKVLKRNNRIPSQFEVVGSSPVRVIAKYNNVSDEINIFASPPSQGNLITGRKSSSPSNIVSVVTTQSGGQKTGERHIIKRKNGKDSNSSISLRKNDRITYYWHIDKYILAVVERAPAGGTSGVSNMEIYTIVRKNDGFVKMSRNISGSILGSNKVKREIVPKFMPDGEAALVHVKRTPTNLDYTRFGTNKNRLLYVDLNLAESALAESWESKTTKSTFSASTSFVKSTCPSKHLNVTINTDPTNGKTITSSYSTAWPSYRSGSLLVEKSKLVMKNARLSQPSRPSRWTWPSRSWSWLYR